MQSLLNIFRSRNQLDKFQYFNNVEWVDKNSQYLDPYSLNKTFKYIIINHPYMGCAFDPHIRILPKKIFSKTTSLEDLAKLADAVTVCCYENIEFTDTSLIQPDINQTAIGNIAFIALHHSNANIREKTKENIEEWRRL